MRTTSSALYPVIIAGGSGTRFWPLSRSARPKQFLPLATKRPLIVETLARVSALAPAKRTLVVCGQRHGASMRALLPKLPKGNVLLEPVARNTAPAIALAAAQVAQRDPQGILAVLPSDHHVADVPAFQRALERAAAIARKRGVIVTLGIRPTRPDTGYGYIRVGGASSRGAHHVEAFVEKPDAAKARRYLASGRYVWNAGIFVFRADTLLDEVAAHLPEAAAPLESIRASLGTPRATAVLKREFPKMPAISFDYAIAEKAAHLEVVPTDCGWSDVGSFDALPDVRPVDAQGNVADAKHALLIDSSGCVVLGGERPVALVGMKDVVVVDAGDALLVLPKARSQDVRKVVQALEARGLREYL